MRSRAFLGEFGMLPSQGARSESVSLGGLRSFILNLEGI